MSIEEKESQSGQTSEPRWKKDGLGPPDPWTKEELDAGAEELAEALREGLRRKGIK